jgi:hypothetical protein
MLARPSDALVLALVAGAPVRADRTIVETTESPQVAEALAAFVTEDPPAHKPSSTSWPRKPSARTHPSQPAPNGSCTRLVRVRSARHRKPLVLDG